MFAVYTYVTSTLEQVTGMPERWIPVVLCVFGLGMTFGNAVLPRFADRALMPTAGAILLWSAIALACFPLVAHDPWLITLDVFCIGIGGALGPVLQTRLMDVAGDAQNLAAALNHVVSVEHGQVLACKRLVAHYARRQRHFVHRTPPVRLRAAARVK